MLRAQPLGPPIYYVVPKQATFAAQRRLAVASGLEGFCRVRVVSFERLADDVIAECGGDAIPAVTPRGRRIIIAHLLRTLSDKLRLYQRSAGRSGLADELDATFVELESNGHDAASLGDLIERLAAENPDPLHPTQRMRDKLHDVHLLYSAYQDFLATDRLDPHRRLRQVLDVIRQADSIRGADVFVDGHLDFSYVECRLIAALVRQAKSVLVTMLIDDDCALRPDWTSQARDDSLFHRTERACARLRSVLERESIVVPPAQKLVPPSKPAAPLRRLEAALFVPDAAPIATAGEILAVEAPDRRGEVACAATRIRRWMRQDGLRPRQIAVLCRNLTPWHDLIEAEFAEHGIPFFSDRRRSASHHPLLQIIPAMLSAAMDRYPHESMMTLAKSGLCGIDRPAADELENYVLRHSILGEGWSSADPWAFNQPEADEDEPPRAGDFADPLRLRLINPLKPLKEALLAKEPRPVRELVAAVYQAIVDYGADAALAGQIEHAEQTRQLELAAEHEQVWEEFTELLDEVVDLLGQESVSPADFAEMMANALSQFDLAIRPPTVDQVLVGDFERTRFEHFDAVILLGFNEGEFPRLAAEPTVLGDAERQRLVGSGTTGFTLDADTRRQLLDESFLAYIAVTRAQRRLCITRRLADDDGRAVNASMFWRELRRLLPDAFPPDRGDDDPPPPPPAIAPTPRSIVARLAAWARGGKSAIEADPSSTALYQAIALRLEKSDPTGGVLPRSWAALRYRNDAQLDPRTVARLFSGTLDASVSQIESFAKCPYQHFAHSILRLRPRPEPELTSLDLGTLMHTVLETLVARQVKAKHPWNPKHNPSTEQIRQAAHAAGERLRGEVMLASARNKYVLATIERAVGEVLEWQNEIGSQGKLQPAGVEVIFGNLPASPEAPESIRLDPLELTTPAGRTVRLRGKVDRVDLPLEGKGTAPFAVFDYKTRNDSLYMAGVYHGLALQLLTYLLVLEANGAQLAGRPLTPAAAFYIKLMRSIELLKHPTDAPPTPQMRGIVNIEHAGSLQPAGGATFIRLGVNKSDGKFNATRSGDGASAEEFTALLGYVRGKIAALVDQICAGDISIRPYRIGETTPCGHCDFRSLCRFDPAINQYDTRDSLNRKEVLERIMEEQSP